MSDALLAGIIGSVGTVIAAVIVGIAGGVISYKYNTARDKQDKESQWRQHAIELTKLDLERSMRWRDQTIEILKLTQSNEIEATSLDSSSPQAPILSFLANYRDVEELGEYSPTQLWEKILQDRISSNQVQPEQQDTLSSGGGVSN